MRYRTLGRTGIKVSPYCLGAMMFGAMGNPDHDDSVRIIHKALDAGINFVDTADAYSRGESEEIVGKALKGRRDNVVLATKAHLPMGDDPNQQGNSRRWLVRALEDSLRRLGTDHVDLFQIHRPAPDTDIEETLSALTDLVRAGKVRAIGSSAFPATDIVEAQWTAERRGLQRFRTEQPTYSILNRGIEREVLPACERYGIGALVWSPLAGGLLTGRYRKGQEATTHRAGFGFKHLKDERRLDVVEQLIPLAEKAGMPLTHLATAFAIAHPGVTSAIIGPRTMAHLDDLLAGAEVRLSDEILDRIDAVVPPAPTSGGSTWRTTRPPSSRPRCGAAPTPSVPPPDEGGVRGRPGGTGGVLGRAPGSPGSVRVRVLRARHPWRTQPAAPASHLSRSSSYALKRWRLWSSSSATSVPWCRASTGGRHRRTDCSARVRTFTSGSSRSPTAARSASIPPRASSSRNAASRTCRGRP